MNSAPETRPSRAWLIFALITTVLWGVWGALIELPEKAGFPPTLGYVAWALTMVPCAVVALALAGWKLERNGRAIALGLLTGISGAGGQLVLFQALKLGPAFIVFPLISLYPVIAIFLSLALLKERAPVRHWIGIALSLPGIVLLSYVAPGDTTVVGYGWLLLASGTLLAWGVQAFVMKFSQTSMSAESLFFYMTVAGLALVPAAWWMTDFSQPVNWGGDGVGAALGIHLLNAAGALTVVYAFRHGKAIIVAPMTALAPVITIALSLAIYHRTPPAPNVAGMVFALLSIFLMAL